MQISFTAAESSGFTVVSFGRTTVCEHSCWAGGSEGWWIIHFCKENTSCRKAFTEQPLENVADLYSLLLFFFGEHTYFLSILFVILLCRLPFVHLQVSMWTCHFIMHKFPLRSLLQSLCDQRPASSVLLTKSVWGEELYLSHLAVSSEGRGFGVDFCKPTNPQIPSAYNSACQL